jgi:hypothetical protein
MWMFDETCIPVDVSFDLSSGPVELVSTATGLRVSVGGQVQEINQFQEFIRKIENRVTVQIHPRPKRLPVLLSDAPIQQPKIVKVIIRQLENADIASKHLEYLHRLELQDNSVFGAYLSSRTETNVPVNFTVSGEDADFSTEMLLRELYYGLTLPVGIEDGGHVHLCGAHILAIRPNGRIDASILGLNDRAIVSAGRTIRFVGAADSYGSVICQPIGDIEVVINDVV